MNSIPSVFRALGVATILLALSILGAAQALLFIEQQGVIQLLVGKWLGAGFARG